VTALASVMVMFKSADQKPLDASALQLAKEAFANCGTMNLQSESIWSLI
jgi:hypothetical protein